MGTVIDAALIAKSCDGTLIVMKHNAVSRKELLQVKQQMEQTECPILGTVLSMVDYGSFLNKKYYNKSYYNKYYDKYSYYNSDGGEKKKHRKAKAVDTQNGDKR